MGRREHEAMSRNTACGWAVMTLAMTCGALAAARGEAPVFRDLVRRAAEQRPADAVPPRLPGVARDVKQALALEYSVLLHQEGKDLPVDASSHEFHQGDQIRVRINPLSDMYVYIFYERAGGQRLCLQPISKESPPLARRNEAFELPTDGSVYEFDAPQGEEKLLIVGTVQPSDDLAAAADLVCRKRDDKLTPQEKADRERIKARSHKVLRSLREEQAHSARYRGLLSEQSLAKLGEELQRQGLAQAVLEEPPHDDQKGTFCMAVSFDKENQPELFVTISLRSVPRSVAKP